jgi:hypothetical protein
LEWVFNRLLQEKVLLFGMYLSELSLHLRLESLGSLMQVEQVALDRVFAELDRGSSMLIYIH